ncbi:macro domain-containing protein [Romboutsia ilealis]|uniref:macro domain-containing protein n=1 Tax=Romboutsia ilealis TaxID=1115758 RepID=UPI0024940BEE|nr:macro domain-containing protein [Romboutsia ilealis]
MSKLNIVSGNILEHLKDKDLIVNSANQYMIYGSGVCGVIYKKANKELLEDYCKQHYKENMIVNEVRITPGFDLGLSILHIYCPKYYESKTPLLDLLDSYNNIFITAKKKGYKNIVSVSLGTGVHGYKHNDIAKDIVIRLDELVKQYDIDFTLILPSEEIKQLYGLR